LICAYLDQIDMTQSPESAREEVKTASPTSGCFDRTSIVLHWLTVLLIVVQFSSALLRETVDRNSAIAATLLNTHRSSGVLIWIVIMVRLVWRHNFAYLPPFPEGMPRLQQTIAKANEYSLYALLLIQPITGLGRVLFRGASFDLFIWGVPALIEPNDAIRHFFEEVHELGAKALLALIALHAGGVLYHQLILRNGVLARMLPWNLQAVGGNKAQPQQAVNEAE
jgi:cytochrome b561